jgi:hypothetical protein
MPEFVEAAESAPLSAPVEVPVPPPMPLSATSSRTPPPLFPVRSTPVGRPQPTPVTRASQPVSKQPAQLPKIPSGVSTFTGSPRPWNRYCARMLDTYCGGNLLVNLIVVPIIPELAQDLWLRQWLFVPLMWLFAESVLLSVVGTTPGKWLFGVRVRTAANERLNFAVAMHRSFSVYLRGMGAGVPVVSLFTVLAAYNRLQAEKITTWDRDAGLRVEQGTGWLGWSLLILIAVLLFFVVLAAANR